MLKCYIIQEMHCVFQRRMLTGFVRTTKLLGTEKTLCAYKTVVTPSSPLFSLPKTSVNLPSGCLKQKSIS
jgi:hypothetical protein